MTALIRQIQPVWFQMQRLELPVPPHALRNALFALGAGLLLMAGLAAGSTFWAPTRVWWDATGASSAMTAGVQASLLAALATAVGALPVFLVQRVSKRQESALMSFAAGVMLAAAIFALLLPSIDAGQALLAATGSARTGLALNRQFAGQPGKADCGRQQIAIARHHLRKSSALRISRGARVKIQHHTDLQACCAGADETVGKAAGCACRRACRQRQIDKLRPDRFQRGKAHLGAVGRNQRTLFGIEHLVRPPAAHIPPQPPGKSDAEQHHQRDQPQQPAARRTASRRSSSSSWAWSRPQA